MLLLLKAIEELVFKSGRELRCLVDLHVGEMEEEALSGIRPLCRSSLLVRDLIKLIST